ncbi:MAG: hypothetical protein J2P22_04105 [Nocardioides sp.]|nr:hypothetical protein [Nocardioides sp.]
MSGISNERFYPASPDEVFDALKAAAILLRFKIKGSDEYSRSVTLSTPAQGFSWGATMGTQVLPAEGGAMVRVGGEQRVRTNFTARSAEYKNTIRLLDKVSAVLQED